MGERQEAGVAGLERRDVIEDHHHWWSLNWITGHWPLLAGLGATVVGAFWLALHKRFPTHNEMMHCKADLSARIDRHEEWEENEHRRTSKENSGEHAEIKADMYETRKEMGFIRHELGELKNLLISMGNNK